MTEVRNKLVDITNPNLDSYELLDNILDYCIYLEGEDPASTIELDEKDGNHISSFISYREKYEWEKDEDIPIDEESVLSSAKTGAPVFAKKKEKLKVKKITIDDHKKERVSKFHFGGEFDSNQSKYEIL